MKQATADALEKIKRPIIFDALLAIIGACLGAVIALHL